MAKSDKPRLCTFPDCFSCPYGDCHYEQMTIDEYLSSLERDREYAVKVLKEYKPQSEAMDGRKPYFRQYYEANREAIRARQRAYFKRHPDKRTRDDRKAYQADYYKRHRQELNNKAKARYREMREALSATG